MDNLIGGFNEFSFKVLNRINDQTEVQQNIVFSSFSLVLALLMALGGSKNDTRNELIRNLYIDSFINKNTDESFYQTLHANLIGHYMNRSQDEKNKMIISNKVLVNNENLLESYVNLLEKRFDAKLDLVRDGSIKKIIKDTNDFIANITNNKIQNLLDESFETASLVLINVVYFNFDWLHKFDENKTEPNQNFYLDSSRTKFSKLNMMNMVGKRLSYTYLDSINSHLIKLPYQNEKYYFNIIFPRENDYLNKIEKSSIINHMDYAYLKTVLFSQTEYEKLINLRMPKFSIKSKFEFSSLLKNLGIVKAFSPKDADFSGITGSNDLYLDKVIQNAFIEINEKGTEAAAATAIKVVKRSIEVPLDINLDRPFIFLITDNSNGLILFSGIFKGSDDRRESQKDEL